MAEALEKTSRGKIAERLRCVWAKLSGAPQLRNLSLGQAIRCSLLRYEGLKKRRCAKQMRVVPDEDLFRVSIADKSIYWPSSDGVDRLVHFFLETFDRANPHQYESYGTIVDDGDVVIDVGGCEGYFALKTAKRASRLIVFEPVEIMARCLSKTLAPEISEGKVEIVSAMLGRETGDMPFVLSGEHTGFSHALHDGEDISQAITVRTTTLDAFLGEAGLDRVDYIKADVEGLELDLIEGSRETIARHRPKIAITCYHRRDHANQLVEFIQEIEPAYRFKIKGVVDVRGVPRPILAHFWCESGRDSFVGQATS